MENVTEELGEETQLGEITFEKTFTFFQLKLKHYEKAAKFEKKSPTCTCFDIYSIASRQVGDFFKLLRPFQIV